jgi:hypothetical protein
MTASESRAWIRAELSAYGLYVAINSLIIYYKMEVVVC